MPYERSGKYVGRGERQKKLRDLEAAVKERGWKMYEDIAAEIVDAPDERPSQSVVANALMAIIRLAKDTKEFGDHHIQRIGRKTYVSPEVAAILKERVLKDL